jgi:hypothetical protein
MTPRTRTRATLVALVTLALASPAFAATTPPGVNIRWDNCFDDGGLMNKTFACNTNAGQEQLVVSLVLAEPMLDVSGQEIVVDIRSASATLPAWWAFKNAGTCRLNSLAFTVGAVGSEVNCTEWSGGQAVGGIGAYQIGSPGPNGALLKAAVAVPSTALAALDPGVEYISGRLRINNLKTTGTGACAGCTEPVCIYLTSINVTSPVLGNNVRLTTGANDVASQIVTWQDGLVRNLASNCGLVGCFPTFDCVLAPPTSARNSTWGAVKSLYR